jgi:hypothetical protein
MTGVYYFLLLQQLTNVPSPNVANMAANIRGIVYVYVYIYCCYFNFVILIFVYIVYKN